MPKATAEEGSNFTLDEGRWYRAKLISVEVRHKEGGISRRTNKPFDPFDKWLWKFEVTEGEKAGQWAYQETDDRLKVADGDLVFQFASALRQEPYALGEDLDTDDLLDLECDIKVANITYTKGDGSTGYKSPVVAAQPPGSGADGEDPWASGGDEPPF